MTVSPLNLPSPQLVNPSIDFTSLGNLGQVYREGQKRQTLADLGKGLSDGSIDYRTAAGRAAEVGDMDTATKFLTLAQAQKKQDDELAAGNSFTAAVSPYFSGQAAPAAAPSPNPRQPAAPNGVSDVPPASAPSAASRGPVASSPAVWGDKEAEAAGLYPPSGNSGAGAPLTLATLGNIGTLPPANNTNSMVRADGAPPATQPQQRQEAPQGPPQQQVPIPVLLQAIGNPRLPTAQRELAGKLLTRALDEQKQPDKIRTLQALKEQSGYAGSILDLEKELRASGKSEVNIDQRGETEEAKASGKAAGERRATMFASAGAASKTLQNLARTEALLNQVEQGKLSPAKMSISAWAKALGMNDDVAASLGLDPKGVGSAQALQSLTNESVVGKIGAGGFPANNFSDADREFITDIFPKLSNDPRANKIIVEGARRMAQLDIQRAKEYQSWKRDGANAKKTFEDFELHWGDKVSQRDVFGDLRRDAEKIIGQPRGDIGGTLQNPGPAPQQAQPQQQPAQSSDGWQDVGPGIRFRQVR